MVKQFLTVYAPTSSKFDEQLNAAYIDGYTNIVDFKYVEYVHTVKNEGPTVMQSYVAILRR